MSRRPGFLNKAYYNTGTDGTPVWNEIPNIKDLDMPIQSDEADDSNRGGGGWEMILPALHKLTVSFAMSHDPEDPDYIVLRDAHANRTLKDFAFASGAIAAEGTEYLRAYMYVTASGREEKLKEGTNVPITLRPGFTASRNPAWVDVEEE